MGIAAIENQQDSVQVHLCHDKYIQWLHIFSHVQEINSFFFFFLKIFFITSETFLVCINKIEQSAATKTLIAFSKIQRFLYRNNVCTSV